MRTKSSDGISIASMDGIESRESESARREQGGLKFHVLVVDDDPEILESIRFALAKDGFLVSLARDGNQALAITGTITPDLIVLDLMMPRRSGFLVLEKLCQADHDPIPVIVITGNEGKRHRHYALMLGASDYIVKPFSMDRLLSSVHSLLRITPVSSKTELH